MLIKNAKKVKAKYIITDFATVTSKFAASPYGGMEETKTLSTRRLIISNPGRLADMIQSSF
jgi:hypothetical protein